MGRTRRTKKRSHVDQEGQEEKPTPNTFVMERGRVGRTLGQLVRDLRRVMEPHTASKLKVRQRNVLMDFVNVAGPLGVSHFLILSRSQTHVNLRICRLPRGPTVTFHITGFSLTRDVISSVRKTATSLTQYMTAPLLILNNFSPEDKSSKLMAAMLQSMLPSLNVQTVKLANINRCVLFNYNTDDKTIELRHYSIRAVARGISRAVKRLGKASVPNLSRYQDISEYMLGGNVSESEGEEVAGQEVTLPQNLRGRGNLKSTQSSVRLIELGPRLTLQLVKVEAGMCKGEVLHHEFIQKTKREARDVRRRVEDREKLRSQRRRQQEENVTRKKRETELHKQRCLEGLKGKKQEDESGSEEEDDREWFRQEVGEEPDPDMLVPAGGGTRKRRGRGAGGTPAKRSRVEIRGKMKWRGSQQGAGGGGEGVRRGRGGKVKWRGSQQGAGGGGEGVRRGRGGNVKWRGSQQGGREGVRRGRGLGKVGMGKFSSKKTGGWTTGRGKARVRKTRTH